MLWMSLSVWYWLNGVVFMVMIEGIVVNFC